MNRLIALALTTCTVFAGPAAMAQTNPGLTAETSSGVGSGSWQGAPEGVTERLGWLDMRLKSGVQDGSITASEAARVSAMLRKTRALQARLLSRDGGTLNPEDSRSLQARVDNMSTQIHWARANALNSHAPN